MPRDKMETITGRMVNPTTITHEEISLEDVAHALSRINRYCGHISVENFSVAEHCWRVAYAAKQLGYSRAAQRWALVHDGTEAYLNDIVRPVKPQISGYKEVEDFVETRILRRFKINTLDFAGIKNIDFNIVKNERDQIKPYFARNDRYWTEDERTVMPEPSNWLSRLTGIRVGKARYGWRPDVAKRRFLALAAELGVW
ncbi:MAG: hypothetical protein GY906_23055 [bacterium]|nr:hypothetical protein [bacterium]